MQGRMFGKSGKTVLGVVGLCLSTAPYLLWASPLIAGESTAAQQPAAKAVDFNKDILPIFKAECISCHGKKNPAAKLDLSTYEATMKGGVNKNLIVKKKSASSLLVKRIIPEGQAPIMPVGAKPLTTAKIKLIRDWIDQGAKKSASAESIAAPEPTRPAAVIPVEKKS